MNLCIAPTGTKGAPCGQPREADCHTNPTFRHIFIEHIQLATGTCGRCNEPAVARCYGHGLCRLAGVKLCEGHLKDHNEQQVLYEIAPRV